MRFFSLIILVATVYVTGVFVLPAQTDKLAASLGILNWNLSLRALKSGADGVSETLVQAQKSNTGGVLDNLKDIGQQARDAVSTIDAVTQQKIDQVKKVSDSVQKTAAAVSELRNSVSDLTSIPDSGSVSASGSASVSGTGSGNSH